MPSRRASGTRCGAVQSGDELGRHTSPGRGRDRRLLDELGQRLTLVQDSLDFANDLGLDANGEKVAERILAV